MKKRLRKKLVCKTIDCIDNIGTNNKDFRYGCVAWGNDACKQNCYTKTRKEFEKASEKHL